MNESRKVQAHHLERDAYLYIRQSSMKQVVENVESTKRQYALRARAAALGWADERIIVIDSDSMLFPCAHNYDAGIIHAAGAEVRGLLRYCARPPLANDRLVREPDGRYVLKLKTRWRDGTTHLRLEPIELMERLAAQIPKPRINLVLYAGVLAPNAKWRREVVGHNCPQASQEPPATETLTRSERESWAELMRHL